MLFNSKTSSSLRVQEKKLPNLQSTKKRVSRIYKEFSYVSKNKIIQYKNGQRTLMITSKKNRIDELMRKMLNFFSYQRNLS